MRSVLGGSRTRSGPAGENENEMQGSDLDGGDVEEEERKKRKLGWRVRRWGGMIWADMFAAGISFSITTIELVLANFVHNFDWTLPGRARGEDLDMTESTGLTIHRKFPLMAIATPYSG
ncbi:cytochrome p450 71a25 [Quercus suber]|uniref:Cytochrome p450 71a25 n=1 Tax=Quercus suber TaxID=58331 RepID=A0AAW0JUN2_QUESU